MQLKKAVVTSEEEEEEEEEEASATGVMNEEADECVSFTDSAANLRLLQRRLSLIMNKPIPLEHVTKCVPFCLSSIGAYLGLY